MRRRRKYRKHKLIKEEKQDRQEEAAVKRAHLEVFMGDKGDVTL
jgi:hypothetical protein